MISRPGSRARARTIRPTLVLLVAGGLAALGAVGSGRQNGPIRPPVSDDPDALYAAREDLADAHGAADVWERRLAATPDDFESAWKLARACYFLGSHVPKAEQRAQYERGIEAGRNAAALQPMRPEGHFWMAANMGSMAEGFGMRAGLKYRGPIKQALEKALAIDAGYEQGSPDRALGRWYAKVPRLFGGSDAKAIEHLERSLTYAPQSIASHFFLAETYLEMNRKAEARRALETVIAAPHHPDWLPEEREYKQRARRLLNELAH